MPGTEDSFSAQTRRVRRKPGQGATPASQFVPWLVLRVWTGNSLPSSTKQTTCSSTRSSPHTQEMDHSRPHTRRRTTQAPVPPPSQSHTTTATAQGALSVNTGPEKCSETRSRDEEQAPNRSQGHPWAGKALPEGKQGEDGRRGRQGSAEHRRPQVSRRADAVQEGTEKKGKHAEQQVSQSRGPK